MPSAAQPAAQHAAGFESAAVEQSAGGFVVAGYLCCKLVHAQDFGCIRAQQVERLCPHAFAALRPHDGYAGEASPVARFVVGDVYSAHTMACGPVYDDEPQFARGIDVGIVAFDISAYFEPAAGCRGESALVHAAGILQQVKHVDVGWFRCPEYDVCAGEFHISNGVRYRMERASVASSVYSMSLPTATPRASWVRRILRGRRDRSRDI